MGDSLTDDNFGSFNTFPTFNASSGGKLRLVANSGIAANTVSSMLSRVHNSYLAATPGVAGLADLAWIIVRGGTNDARALTPISTLAPTYTNLMNALAGYATRVLVLSVPPLAVPAENALTIAYNAWLENFAKADPEQFTYVDDASQLRGSSGEQLPIYFNGDGVHYSAQGTGQSGTTAAEALTHALRGYPSLVSDSAADVFPTHPQWVINPTMLGTGGSKSGSITGTVANSITISGTGLTAVCALVSAAPEDVNAVQWQRVTINASTTGNGLSIKFATAGRSMSSVDPTGLEVVMEVRLNGLDTSVAYQMTQYIQANTTEYISPQIKVAFPIAPALSKKYVLRNNRQRAGATTPASLNFYLNLNFVASFAVPIGSIDVRCVTARG